jgi:ribosomal protein uS7
LPVIITLAVSNSFLYRALDDLEISDISLTDYIAVSGKHATFLPHTAGRYQKKRFRKAACPLVERLTVNLMRKGRNSGKKLLAARIVRSTMEIIHLLTDQNPMQVSIPLSYIDSKSRCWSFQSCTAIAELSTVLQFS